QSGAERERLAWGAVARGQGTHGDVRSTYAVGRRACSATVLQEPGAVRRARAPILVVERRIRSEAPAPVGVQRRPALRRELVARQRLGDVRRIEEELDAQRCVLLQ